MLPPQQGRQPRFCRSAPHELLHPEEGKGKITLNNNWKDKAYSYFCHEKCEYFPCHAGADRSNFNGLFCYCPLYVLGKKCGGDFVYREDGVKDCTACLYPHLRENYGEIVDRYREILAAIREKE